jgi:hypothetical protein
MPAGRTRPVLLECVRGTATRRERARFVTKAIGLPEVQPFSLAHEFLGSRLAQLYGLKAPGAEIVTLSSAFLDATRLDLEAARLRPQPGLAVGTEFVSDLLPFPVPVRLEDDEVVEAAAVYVFDLLTQNPDRSRTSPNCGRAARHVVPFDFETAFSFRFAIPRLDPWRVGDLAFARTHLFHEALVRSDIDWRAVFAQFSAVTMTAVTEVCSTIPGVWAEVGEDVRTHIAAVLDHWLQFEQEITISLGNAR